MSAIRKEQDERATAGVRRRRADEDNDYDEYENDDEYEEDEYEDEDEDEYQEEDEGEDRHEKAPARRDKGAKLSAMDVGEAGLRHLAAIVTKTVEGVTAVRPSDSGWTVEIEVLDSRHIPSSSDTLALYEVEVDPTGELMSYRRTAMYSRARGREMR